MTMKGKIGKLFEEENADIISYEKAEDRDFEQVEASESRIYHKNKVNINITEPIIIIPNAKEKYGVLLENCHHVTIENVQVLKSELACLIIKNCHHVTIKNCIFEGSQKGQGILLINCFDIQLENIICRNHGNIGIDIQQGCHEISILSSTALNNVKAALRIIDSNNVTLNKGSFGKSSKGSGIIVSNAFAIQIENINCRRNAAIGIDIEKDCYDISITTSQLLGNAETGLRMVASCNITGSKLRLNNSQQGNGVWLKDVQNIQFQDCHFNNNNLSGIYLENCSDAVFATSTFHNNKNGMYLNKIDNLQFMYCKFNYNEAYALNILKSESLFITNPEIHFNKGNYAKMEKSSIEIMNCELHGKGQFILRSRSIMKTNLAEASRIVLMFKDSIFDVDYDSELMMIQ